MYAAALLQGWRFSAFRDALLQTSVAASGYLSSSHLRQCSVWTSSSCHCVDTASLKKKKKISTDWITEILSLEFWSSTLKRSSRITEEPFSIQESKQWNIHLCSLDTSRSASTLCTRRIIKRCHICYSFRISGSLTAGEGPTTNPPWEYIRKKWCRPVGTSRVPQGQKFTRSSEDVVFFSVFFGCRSVLFPVWKAISVSRPRVTQCFYSPPAFPW